MSFLFVLQFSGNILNQTQNMFKKLVSGIVSLSFVASLIPVMPAVAAPHKDEHVKVGAVLSGDLMIVFIDGESKTVLRIKKLKSPQK